jgi:hypothetical protein
VSSSNLGRTSKSNCAERYLFLPSPTHGDAAPPYSGRHGEIHTQHEGRATLTSMPTHTLGACSACSAALLYHDKPVTVEGNRASDRGCTARRRRGSSCGGPARRRQDGQAQRIIEITTSSMRVSYRRIRHWTNRPTEFGGRATEFAPRRRNSRAPAANP